MALLCIYCGKLPEEHGGRYERVIAWECPPKRGRGSSLVLREKTGQVACHSCIVALQHGIKLGKQEALF